MNERDSETLAGMLTEMGFRETVDEESPDIAIINTCSVRENADKRFFGMLGQYKKYKTRNPGFIMCVCGCMMQQQHIIDDIKMKYPWVDIVFGTHNLHEFPELLKNFSQNHERLIEIWEQGKEIPEDLPSKRLFKHKAFVNIMLGCNNFCSYCIVPYTRGRERSRLAENIEREIFALLEDGVKEITLLGQNVNSYRDDNDINFPMLLERIDRFPKLERLRFMTSHPKDLSDELIEKIGKLRTLCNYIHLPVQSGSDSVLKRMNRRYTAADYKKLIDKLREVSPDIAVSTDIIVGFPGETDEDFEETLKLSEEVGFDSAFTFLYSIRKGTPAENFKEHIPEEIKHQRFNRLVKIIEDSSGEKNKLREGKTERVLVEGYAKTVNREDGIMLGRTSQNKIVNFKGSDELIGELIDVYIEKANRYTLEGRLL